MVSMVNKVFEAQCKQGVRHQAHFWKANDLGFVHILLCKGEGYHESHMSWLVQGEEVPRSS